MDPKLGPLRPGDVFCDRWQIEGLIGKGGHAFVYKAFDRFLGLDCALKTIPSEEDTGKQLADKARAEARVLARVHHSNVVGMFTADRTQDGLTYIAMELLQGRDLRQVIEQYGRLTLFEVIEIALQICEGGAAAHAAGAIHRDLKPANIFISTNNLVKLVDFGIAKAKEYGGAKTTQKDLVHGTVFYMAPEQLSGLGATERSDVFATGTLLYEAVYRHPLRAAGQRIESLEQALFLQVSREPPLLSEVDPGVPAFFADWVQRFIKRNPNERWSSMKEALEQGKLIRKQLHRWAGERGLPVTIRDLSVSDPSQGIPNQSPGVRAETDRAPATIEDARPPFETELPNATVQRAMPSGGSAGDRAASVSQPKSQASSRHRPASATREQLNPDALRLPPPGSGFTSCREAAASGLFSDPSKLTDWISLVVSDSNVALPMTERLLLLERQFDHDVGSKGQRYLSLLIDSTYDPATGEAENGRVIELYPPAHHSMVTAHREVPPADPSTRSGARREPKSAAAAKPTSTARRPDAIKHVSVRQVTPPPTSAGVKSVPSWSLSGSTVLLVAALAVAALGLTGGVLYGIARLNGPGVNVASSSPEAVVTPDVSMERPAASVSRPPQQDITVPTSATASTSPKEPTAINPPAIAPAAPPPPAPKPIKAAAKTTITPREISAMEKRIERFERELSQPPTPTPSAKQYGPIDLSGAE